MELYQLRTFVTVAREGNLTRAAERLFSSQPAVSGQIKALEEELGLKLFDRTSSGMIPTPAGEKLWDEAERVLGASKDFLSSAAALKGSISGQLRLGLNSGGGTLRGAELLALLRQRHPNLRFEISSGTSGAVLEGVVARDLDIGSFEGECEEPTLEAIALQPLDLLLVVPPAWANELADANWSEMQAKPWAFGSTHCSFYRFFEKFCRARGFAITPHFQIDGEGTSLELVASGLAITLTTRQRLESAPDVAARVSVWPHFHEKLPLSICFLRSRSKDPLIRAVIDAAREVWSTPKLEPVATH